MLDFRCWDPYRIEYNEELKRWDFSVNDDIIASGDFLHCLDFMYSYLCDTDTDTIDNSAEDNKGLINDFLYCRASDDDLDDYLISERVDAAREETEAQEMALQFAVDVLDIMRTARSELLTADAFDRQAIKLTAYEAIRELIDHTSEKMREKNII